MSPGEIIASFSYVRNITNEGVTVFLAKLSPAASLAEKRNSLHRGEHRVKPVFALLPKNTAAPANEANDSVYLIHG